MSPVDIQCKRGASLASHRGELTHDHGPKSTNLAGFSPLIMAGVYSSGASASILWRSSQILNCPILSTQRSAAPANSTAAAANGKRRPNASASQPPANAPVARPASPSSLLTDPTRPMNSGGTIFCRTEEASTFHTTAWHMYPASATATTIVFVVAETTANETAPSVSAAAMDRP